MSDGSYGELVSQLAATPQLVAQLLHAHTPTAGGWCRDHHAHRERHPCTIRRLAESAAGRAGMAVDTPRAG
jgi:hypothetical protein